MTEHVEVPVPEEALKAGVDEAHRQLGEPVENAMDLVVVRERVGKVLQAAAPFIAAKAVEERDTQKVVATEGAEIVSDLRDRAEKAEADYRSLMAELTRLVGPLMADRPGITLNDQIIERVAAVLSRAEKAERERDSLSESYERMKRARTEALHERDQAIERVREAVQRCPRWTGGYIAAHERDGEYVEVSALQAVLDQKGDTDAC